MSAAVRSANPFALLSEDTDFEAVTKPQAAPAPAPAPAPTAPKQQAKPQGRQAGRYPARGGAQRNAPRSEETGVQAEEKIPRGERGPKSTRGRGGRGGAAGGRGRVFDRHSQTGHIDSAKQEAQGWGGEDGKKELAAEEAGKTDAAAEAAPTVPGTPNGEPAEDEENVKTLDEYLAERAKAALNVDLPEARKANEGVDESQWKDAVPLVKKADEEFITPKEAKARAAKARKEKVTIEIDGQFSRPAGSERGAPRGARGGRGGRGGRGAARGGFEARRGAAPARVTVAQSQVALDDEKAFPSLA